MNPDNSEVEVKPDIDSYLYAYSNQYPMNHSHIYSSQESFRHPTIARDLQQSVHVRPSVCHPENLVSSSRSYEERITSSSESGYTSGSYSTNTLNETANRETNYSVGGDCSTNALSETPSAETGYNTGDCSSNTLNENSNEETGQSTNDCKTIVHESANETTCKFSYYE
ncbi:hypothetical protein Anas_06445 [Armadillidium nasatum]|uniref:Uncharacterized protein n=1 Tax=Armadillidium nasatum TaxID=96803 RepID=A0A5N5TAJ1_9CRUS|nr:hypothetical protein Anas_06445 [Armadillidium nasatum]